MSAQERAEKIVQLNRALDQLYVRKIDLCRRIRALLDALLERYQYLGELLDENNRFLDSIKHLPVWKRLLDWSLAKTIKSISQSLLRQYDEAKAACDFFEEKLLQPWRRELVEIDTEIELKKILLGSLLKEI